MEIIIIINEKRTENYLMHNMRTLKININI